MDFLFPPQIPYFNIHTFDVMSNIYVTQECVLYDNNRFEQVRNKRRRKISEGNDGNDDDNNGNEEGQNSFTKEEAAEAIISIWKEPLLTKDEVNIPITKTAYMLHEFFVYRPEKKSDQPPILIRRPCAKQGKQMTYSEFKELIETVSKVGCLSRKLMILLIKGLDRYIHEKTCPNCVEEIRDSIFLQQCGTKDRSLDDQIMEII